MENMIPFYACMYAVHRLFVCQSVHTEASQHTVTSCKVQAFGPSLKNKVRSVMRCASNFKLHVV